MSQNIHGSQNIASSQQLYDSQQLGSQGYGSGNIYSSQQTLPQRGHGIQTVVGQDVQLTSGSSIAARVRPSSTSNATNQEAIYVHGVTPRGILNG